MNRVCTRNKIRFSSLWLLAACFLLFESHTLAAYPAPQFKDARVYSFLNDNGTSGTGFFARVSGPSPEDISEFTVTGPSETFNLTPGYSFREYGLTYRCSLDTVVENGTYTFSVTDREGRTATVQKTFTYNGTLPQVDSTGMSPANREYVGTTTPTLSAAPVAGDFRYQILVWDMRQKAIWYNADGLTTPTVTVPSGLLQPNTPYYWAVRVWDAESQNYHGSKSFSFFTGTKADPNLDLTGVLSYPSSAGVENFPFARAASTAPWDISTFMVIGPDAQVYNLANTRIYNFYMPAYNAALVILDPPLSIPDGTYQFDLMDTSGKITSASVTYTYDPIPDFSSESRVPEDNAYFDTQRPTFSWSRVTGDTGDGTYRYSLRITDYSTAIRWYESSRSAATSFTLPEGLNLPRGSSYKWRVNVMDTSGNNYRSSDYRTFTINGPVYPVCDIKANGSDGPVVVSASEPVKVTVTLDPGEKAGEDADWWVVAYTPFDPPANWFSYVIPDNWEQGLFMFDRFPLFSLSSPVDVWYEKLPEGHYIFFFSVNSPDSTSVDAFRMMDMVEVEVQ